MNVEEHTRLAAPIDALIAARGPRFFAKEPARPFDDAINLIAGEAHKQGATGMNSIWPKLDPIPELEDKGPAEFPFDALGPVLGGAARAIAQDIQAPDSLAGGSVLAAASIAVQALANVVLPHGQRSPLSVFVITGAGSGDRKSAVDAQACQEVEAVRKQQARDYAKQLERYAADIQGKAKGDPDATKPTPKSVTTANATVEGISRLLKNQSHVGIFSPEGGEMLGGYSMRGEQRPASLAFYLKGWGGESIDSLRGGDGLTVLLNRRMAMHVLVQPVLLGQLLSDPMAQGQGLLARCLIAQPETMAGHRPYKDVNPYENPAVVEYNQVVAALLAQPCPLWPEGDGFELKPRDLPLSADAKALWVNFYNIVERQQARGGELEAVRAFASKAAEHAARIAGIVTLFDNQHATEVPPDAMEGGIVIASFYLVEHIRLMGAGRTERVHANLRALWQWLEAQGALVTQDAVLRKAPRSIRDLKAAGINPLLEELVTRGYIRSVKKQWVMRHV